MKKTGQILWCISCNLLLNSKGKRLNICVVNVRHEIDYVLCEHCAQIEKFNQMYLRKETS